MRARDPVWGRLRERLDDQVDQQAEPREVPLARGGSCAWKIEPSGARTVSVWNVPPSTGRDGLTSSLNATRQAEIVWGTRS